VQGSLGECAGMTLTCTSGAWVGTCTGSPTELCNDDGKDDDCDGQVNEGCECLNGATSSCGVARGYRGDCASRPMTCAGGTWTGACSPTSSEQCNNDGRDEDCDGNPRNGCPCLTGETASCGECGGAITTCSNGVWGSCVTQVSQNRPCGPCGFDLQWCGSSGSWDGCGGNTYAGYYCADGDGDRWCTSCGYHCSQPQYWRPQSECYGSECNDGNSCRTECPGEWVPGGYYEWGKPWRGFGNCEDHYYGGDCPCGTALAACDIWQISGGGNVTDLGGCWARICEDGGTESAAAAWQAWCYVQ
jgi:hypothetical protein